LRFAYFALLCFGQHAEGFHCADPEDEQDVDAAYTPPRAKHALAEEILVALFDRALWQLPRSGRKIERSERAVVDRMLLHSAPNKDDAIQTRLESSKQST
jgi:hypothetical protein